MKVIRLQMIAASGIGLSSEMAAGMKAVGVSDEIISALRTAMINTDRTKDANAWAYASGMQTAWDEYQLPGVKMNVAYMLGNLRHWQGEEARKVKKLLNKWAAS